MSDLRRLVKAIRDLHGVSPTHVRSELVLEAFQGQTVWRGTVEVFAVEGHPKARFAYAWEHETAAGNQRIVAVLGVPPINSALEAVRAAIAADHAAKQGRRVT